MTKIKPNMPAPSVGAVVSHAARLLTLALADAHKSLALAPAQYRILVELWQEDGLTQHALVQKLDLEQSTVGTTLSRMERDGLIQRQPHLNDGRSQLIHLTPHAKALQAPATAAASQINNDILSDFSEREQAQLFEFIDRIICRFKAQP